MDIGSIFLVLAMAVLVGFFVSQPFNRRVSGTSEAGALESRRSGLQAERERLLNVLSELDSDYSLGKVPQEDYPTQRAALLQAGAAVLRQLDELQPPAAVPLAVPKSQTEKTDTQSCPKCGAALHSGDVFCSRCGEKVG